MPDVITRPTRVVNGITLDRRTINDKDTFWVYRRDWGLDVRFEFDGYWHRTTWTYHRGQAPTIERSFLTWFSLADAVQAARADGLITWDTTMPTDITGVGADGHLYEYPVRDRRFDGSLVTTSFNAVHLNECRCQTDPEFWF